MTERKLARVVLIDNVSSIEKADLIDSATVGGWNVVIKKNEFKVGQKAVYFEIDSMIPIEEEKFSFFMLSFKKSLSVHGSGKENVNYIE